MFESTTSQPHRICLERSRLIFRTAASTLAAAIFEVFPGSELLGGGETSTGFFYQFFSSYPLPPESLSMLEECMRGIVRENREIREMEMVACSAREFFEKEGHIAAANALEELEPKELVSIIKIGDFANLMDGPFCSSVREVGAFKLMRLTCMGDSEYRVEGTAFATKEQLKNFLRLFSRYESNNHMQLGVNAGYWMGEERHLIWTSLGLKMRALVIEFLKKSFGSEELCAASLDALDLYGLKKVQKGGAFSACTIHEKAADPEGDQGFFEEQVQTTVCNTLYCKEKEMEELATSLLQRIGKTLIILGFNPQLRLMGRRQGEKGVKFLSYLLSKSELLGNSPVPFEVDEVTASKQAKVQWMVKDGLDRLQPAMELEVGYKENGFAILRLKTGVERIFSLLLELKSGNLPNWLISEHKHSTDRDTEQDTQS